MQKHVLQKWIITSLVLLLIVTATSAQIGLVSNTPYTQNFNTLAGTGTANDTTTIPAGWVFVETGTNANATYAAGTGSSNAGNTYSLGLDADRAFGGLQSGSLIPYIGARFINTTGTIITKLQITYTGEQWRLGATPRAQGDRLDFQYSVNASTIINGIWTDYDALDFTSPILSGTVGALNGNTAANRTVLSETITGLSIPPGSTFWLRWTDFNVASSDDALGIDDFSITAVGAATNQPDITVTPATLNFGQVNINTSKVLPYKVSGTNLSDSLIYITTPSSVFTLSVDQFNYNDSLTISASDTIYVKFSPIVNGTLSDTILHSSSGVSRIVAVTGSGFDPLQNIITIAQARSKTSGTKVTVAGRITVANQQGSPSFIQDATGGIPVFDYNFSNAVAIGDSVIVTGNISIFNNQVQIGSNVSFRKADSTKKFIAPKQITISQLAANEGLLVTVQHVQLVNKAFVFYPQSTEQISDSTIQADLRIDGDTNIPGLTKPQGIVNITGVVGRFKTNAQLLPRFREDLPGATEPQTPFDSIPSSNTFDLMNWNLEFFGAKREDYPEEYGPADEPQQLKNVQHIINSVHADVIAVQEVSNDSLFTELIHELPGYKAICSSRYSYSFQGPDSTFPPQKVCFIYDTTTVQVESARAMFQNIYDSARLYNPSLLPNYPTGDASSFWSSGRLPFMLTANVTVQGVTEKIRFINLHAKSGATVGDYNRRVYDAAVLKDSLDAHYPNDKIVILGDYNDDLHQSIVTGLPTSYANFVQDTSAYNPITLQLSLAGAKSTVSFNGVIDNQIITNELNAEQLQGSAKVITPFLQVQDYANTTSDHLPVVSRFQFTPAIIRFTTTQASVAEALDSVLINIQLSKPLETEKTITIAIQNGAGTTYGSDYTTTPAASNNILQIAIPAGTTTAAVQVHVIDDIDDEQDETLTLKLFSTNGVIADSLGAATYTLTILDNDLPTIAFTETAVSREEGSGAYTVKLKLSSPQSTSQTVTIRAADGQGTYYGNIFDYTTTPAITHGKITLTIPPATQQVEFTVTPNRDLLHENNETITFSITEVSAGIAKGTPAAFTFTIVDTPVCIPLFAVFPNPTFGVITIYTLPSNDDRIIEGTLIDPQGNILASGTATTTQLSEQFTNAMQGKKRGVYIVKLKECDKEVIIRVLKL